MEMFDTWWENRKFWLNEKQEGFDYLKIGAEAGYEQALEDLLGRLYECYDFVDLRTMLYAELGKNFETCWLCGKENPDTTITVEYETPNGKLCKPKDVRVHYDCYLDINS